MNVISVKNICKSFHIGFGVTEGAGAAGACVSGGAGADVGVLGNVAGGAEAGACVPGGAEAGTLGGDGVPESTGRVILNSDGDLPALKDVSFEIKEGDCAVIGGENGSGKSVLMSIISGLEDPDSGTVECYGRVGLVFQEAESQILGETVAEDIAYGPKNLGWKKDRVQGAVAAAMNCVGLSEKADYPARFLSGGEKRRLAVACMLAMEFPIIIFDEPYANLDYMGVKQVNGLIEKLKEQGKTVIILTHEIEKCLGLAKRFIVLFRGCKVFDGSAAEGLALGDDLEKWNIRNPLNSYKSLEDLVW